MAAAEDALRINSMGVNPGGCQPAMGTTFYRAPPLPGAEDTGFRIQRQELTFQPGCQVLADFKIKAAVSPEAAQALQAGNIQSQSVDVAHSVLSASPPVPLKTFTFLCPHCHTQSNFESAQATQARECELPCSNCKQVQAVCIPAVVSLPADKQPPSSEAAAQQQQDLILVKSGYMVGSDKRVDCHLIGLPKGSRQVLMERQLWVPLQSKIKNCQQAKAAKERRAAAKSRRQDSASGSDEDVAAATARCTKKKMMKRRFSSTQQRVASLERWSTRRTSSRVYKRSRQFSS